MTMDHQHAGCLPAAKESARSRVASLLQFSFPILGVNVLQSLSGSLNVVYVGLLLGPGALAATSNANALIFLALGVLGGLANAAMLLIGRAMGRQDCAEIQQFFDATMLLGVLLACVLGLLQWNCAPSALSLMNVPAESAREAIDYMRAMSFTTPLMLLFSLLMMSMRGAGQTKGALLWMTAGIAVESALTPALIVGWGPFPQWGVEGAAVSSTAAQALAFIGLACQLKRSEETMRFSPRAWRWSLDARTRMAQIFREGLPLCFQMLMGSAYAAIVVSIVNDFGSSATAAYAVIMQLWSYAQMPALAMASATAALAARQIGANLPAKLAPLICTSLFCNIVITGTLVFALLTAGPSMMRLLLEGDLQAQHAGNRLNLIAAWSLPCFGASVILFAVLRAQGRFFVPLLTFGITQYAVCWPFILALKSIMGEQAVWWSFPLCYVIPLGVGVYQLRSILAGRA